jgi:hypothetical protein
MDAVVQVRDATVAFENTRALELAPSRDIDMYSTVDDIDPL